MQGVHRQYLALHLVKIMFIPEKFVVGYLCAHPIFGGFHRPCLMMHSIFELFKAKIRIGYENQPIAYLLHKFVILLTPHYIELISTMLFLIHFPVVLSQVKFVKVILSVHRFPCSALACQARYHISSQHYLEVFSLF